MARAASIRVSVRLPRELEEVIVSWARAETRSAELAADVDDQAVEPMGFSEAVRQLLVLGLESCDFHETFRSDGAPLDEWKLPSS